ncbi:hypothetical protein GQ600_6727 [Phytophthora cactorum]|nr:hypothetical protein GQ600_6727 [Phytophthora cactorum]
MVVVRSPTGQNAGEALLADQRRVQMERQAGDSRQLVVMASPEEVRAAQAARQTAATPPSSLATETQRRLLAYAQRTRHVLSHRSMLSEIRRLKEEIQTLQEQIQVTTRSVESMERLAFHLERLTRDFLPQNPSDGVRVVRDRSNLQEVEASTVLAADDLHSDDAPDAS